MQVKPALRLIPNRKLPEIAAAPDLSVRPPNRKLVKADSKCPLYGDAMRRRLNLHDPKGLTAIKYTEQPGT